MFKNIISCNELIDNINDYIIVDCRFKLDDLDYAKNEYSKSHIPNAIFVSLEEELSTKPSIDGHGGRHPIPNLNIFFQNILSKNVFNNKNIAVYDDGNLDGASRFWILSKLVGIENVKVLNGGFTEWRKLGLPVSSEIVSISTSNNNIMTDKINITNDFIVNMNYVKEKIENYKKTHSKTYTLVDSRANERFLGIIEPIDRLPGHIESAINIPFSNIFEYGLVKDIESIKSHFSQITSGNEVIFYCGSGVTACVNFLLFDEIYDTFNIQHKLYAGSYSDWVSYHDNIVVKKIKVYIDFYFFLTYTRYKHMIIELSISLL